MSKKSEKPIEMTFESAMNRIEEIASILEKGEVSIDESLALFEESVRLTSLCEKILKESEQKIQTIMEANREEP